MDKDWRDLLADLVERRRRELNASYVDLDRRGGLPHSGDRSTFREIKDKRKKIDGPEWLGVAEALDIPVGSLLGYLKTGIMIPTQHVLPGGSTLVVMGEIEPERWQLQAARAMTSYGDADVPADPRYDTAHQYALRVCGDSINRVARDGDFLIAVNFHQIPGLSPGEGSLVIVSRLSSRERRPVREITARRLRVAEGVIRYEWDSSADEFSNPEHPEYYAPLQTENGAENDIDTGDKVSVVALVTASFRRITTETTSRITTADYPALPPPR